jgi:hypothetical protein
VFDSHAALLDDLSTPLEFDQREKFNQIAARWAVLTPNAELRGGPLTRVLRAVKDPSLDITVSLREDLMNLVSQAIRENKKSRDDAAKMAAVIADLKANINKQLTPAQQEHFAKTVQELDEEAALEAKEEAEANAAANTTDE